MPAVYLADVVGTGTKLDAFRPNVPAGVGWVAVAIDEQRGRAIFVSDRTDLVGAGLVKLVEGTDWEAMRASARTTVPTGARRVAVLALLRAAGVVDPDPQTTIRDVIHRWARRLDPDADLDVVRLR